MVVQLGEYGNRRHAMEGKECTIGREPTCDVRPDHGRVSNRHSRLFWRGGRLQVEDMNSALGTFVNGDRVFGSTPLEDGDELAVGPVHYLVMQTETEEEMAGRSDSWIASALEARHAGEPRPSDSNIVASPAVRTARQILDKLAGEGDDDGHDDESPRRGRHGLEITEQQGIALARILNRDLIDEVDIRRLGHQLQELINSGRHRIALDLGNVEHASSQALSTMLEAFQRCRDVGGALKVCTVQPAVAQLFVMTNLQKHIEVHPDQVQALDSVWPQPASRGEDPPGHLHVPIAPAPAGEPTVRLIVEVGKSKGKIIEITGRRFVIGRDPRCQLRPNSDTISRIHAIIERRDGKVTVRDYGTRNGTVLGDRTLRGEEAEARDGDAMQVGVLRFSLQVLPPAAGPPPGDEDDLAAWLLEQGPADADAPTSLLIPTLGGPDSPMPGDGADAGAEPHADPGLSTASLACEIVRGVLVGRIREPRLDDEASVGPLRFEFQSFFDKPLPRRVVLSLEHVDFLSSRAVGVLLAFFQHLDREHGALRIACVGPHLIDTLDSMRLPKLVDLYPTVEEAVDDPWT